MLLETNIIVNLDDVSDEPLLNMKQFDSGNVINIEIRQRGQKYIVGKETTRIYIVKPDKTKVYQEMTVTNEGTVKMGVTNQTLAVPGIAQAEIEFQGFDTTEIVTTPIFKIKIWPTNIDDSYIESTDEFTALEEALRKVDQDSIDEIKENIQELFDSRTTMQQEIDSVQALFSGLDTRVTNLESRHLDGSLDGRQLTIFISEG